MIFEKSNARNYGFVLGFFAAFILAAMFLYLALFFHNISDGIKRAAIAFSIILILTLSGAAIKRYIG